MTLPIWLRFGIASIILIIESISDLKKRKINMIFLAIGIIAGVAMLIYEFGRVWQSALGGLAVGMAIILVAQITDEKIGYGDGILIACLGLILGGRYTVTMILFGCLACCLVSMILLACGKAGKQTKLPFVPFLIPGVVVTLCLEMS